MSQHQSELTPAGRLRRLIESGTTIAAPGAYDSFSARLVERAGFDAVYLTGLGATASRLGTPDLGLLSQTEMTEHARNMTRAVSIPVIADADTGYGGPANTERTVREHVQSGVAAIHLEDQMLPKRCGQLGGLKLVDAEAHVRNLRCALDARGSDDLLIIGRTDAIGPLGTAEAVRRAKLYQDTGVDLVFVDGITKIREVEEVAAQVPGPKVVSIVDGNETTALTIRDLDELGFSVVFYAVTALFTATRAVSDTLTALREHGAPGHGPASASYAEFAEVVDLPAFEHLDHDYGNENRK